MVVHGRESGGYKRTRGRKGIGMMNGMGGVERMGSDERETP